MDKNISSNNLSLTWQVLVGSLLGILAGLFFGPYTKILRPIGDVYVMLMESVVYPYIFASLLHGLGSITPKIATRIFKKNWAFYLLLISISFFIIWLLSLALPESNSSIIGPNATSSNSVEGFLERLIPNNLFSALVKNYMPAIIIFCLLFGFALQHYKDKQSVLETLSTIKAASLQVWNWIILTSPYAAFSLVAYTTGTISFTTFENIALYLTLFFLGTFLLTFWIVPLLITSFISITYKEVIQLLREALLIALATSLSVAALPYIESATKLLLLRHTSNLDEEMEKVTETITTMSYPFGQIGNLFLYLFIIFASVYFQHPIFLETLGKLFLIILTYFSSLGSPSSTIDSVGFLANWTFLPVQTTSLFVELLPITRYGQVLTSVMGMAFISIVSSFAYFQLIHVRWRALIFCILTSVFALSILSLINVKFNVFNKITPNSILNFRLSPEITAHTQVTFNAPTQQSFSNLNSSTLHRIRQTGVLRVGYNEHMIPFVYFNKYNELVGFDVAFMYDLAKTLGVAITFIHFDFFNLIEDIEANKFDVAIGSIYVIPSRLLKASYTQPYFRDRPAFIVKKDRVDDFKDVNSIAQIQNLKIAVFNDPVMIPLAKENFPNAKFVIIPNMDALTPELDVDGALWTQEHTQAWASVHPGYASVTSHGLKNPAPLLMAYILRKDEQDFLWFLNYWLKIKETDGFTRQEYEYWLLGKPRPSREPRWSIIHNVLHWV
ncbi:Na /H -dicarboxylate symporter [Legionella busanensis]|uniref:Na /H -dicarboxylate symporter n=1 Tax=Legionella busanensis TaxID=190655 RepID=A0A378JL72_9GAMM|nr:cation:dicarboxylase symporter family transporter [Legionella busanensis]STX51063.1 Na /H -dicarboxylate symporter [Legionella busanensis]